MDNNEQIPLTSAEIGMLWIGYRNGTLSYYLFKHFEQTVADQDIKQEIESALAMYQQHINDIKELFTKESFPIPIGFSEHDLNLNAPRLFSDNTAFFLLKLLHEAGVMFYSGNLRLMARQDIRDYVNEALDSYVQGINRITDVMLTKGIYVRPPVIPLPDSIDFVKSQNFLTGWFGERRPVHATQIAHLFLNIQRNVISKTLLIGLSQTVKSNELRDYLKRGVKMSEENIDSFNIFLKEAGVDSGIPTGLNVTTSTECPFSDKLVLGLMITIIRFANCFYGEDLSISSRRDLFAFYSKLIAETTIYANENIKLAIKLGFQEEQPKAVDHMDIINKMNS